MNAPVTFNTLAFVRRLEAAGVDTRQAEALADAFGDALQETVASKGDVMLLARDTRDGTAAVQHDLRETELRLQKEIKDLEVRLTTRMGAMMAGSAAVVIAILGTLIGLHH